MSDKTVHTVFRSFIRELTRTTPVPYSNHPKVIQSSVGMIFRLKSQNAFSSLQHILNGSFEGIDLLFTQRAGYEKDRNACIYSNMQITSYSQVGNVMEKKLISRLVNEN